MAAERKYRTILLFGMPGSGKGTQGAVLGQLPGLVHISCGDVFRKIPKYGTLGKEIVNYTSQGLLVPDDLTVRIWERHIKILELQEFLLPEIHTLILDGLPRNYAQAERLDDMLDVVQIFHLKINDTAKAAERLKSRALRENRLDDINEEVIRRRLKTYYDETYQTLSFYDPTLIYDIDAGQPPLDVLRDIIDRMSDLQHSGPPTAGLGRSEPRWPGRGPLPGPPRRLRWRPVRASAAACAGAPPARGSRPGPSRPESPESGCRSILRPSRVDAAPPHRPYVADSAAMPELTWSAVLLGALLGIIFGASSLYLVLKVGMTVSASIPVAVLSITLFRAFSKASGTRPATILENNIVQTAGSAGESIAFGVGVTMPALMILGYDMEAVAGHAGRGPGRPAGHPDDDPAAPGVHRQAAREPRLPRGDRLRQGPDRGRAGRARAPDGLHRVRDGVRLSGPDGGPEALAAVPGAGVPATSRGRSCACEVSPDPAGRRLHHRPPDRLGHVRRRACWRTWS